jgi:hypothetical protein
MKSSIVSTKEWVLKYKSSKLKYAACVEGKFISFSFWSIKVVLPVPLAPFMPISLFSQFILPKRNLRYSSEDLWIKDSDF